MGFSGSSTETRGKQRGKRRRYAIPEPGASGRSKTVRLKNLFAGSGRSRPKTSGPLFGPRVRQNRHSLNGEPPDQEWALMAWQRQRPYIRAMNRETAIAKLRENAEALKSLGATALYLYGSTARDEATSEGTTSNLDMRKREIYCGRCGLRNWVGGLCFLP